MANISKAQYAQWLGYAGLIPFVFSALFVWIFHGEVQSFTLFALKAYGAVILSFLGGIQWGRAIFKEDVTGYVFGLSVLPSLAGWTALFLPDVIAFGLLITGFAGQYFYDVKTYKDVWFLRLRLHLTFGAIASLISGFIFVI